MERRVDEREMNEHEKNFYAVMFADLFEEDGILMMMASGYILHLI